MSDEALTLRHEPERRRFVAETAQGNGGVLDYVVVDAGTLDYRHTYVPVALRGRGIANKLVAFALDHARAEGLSVIPTCPFVASIMERHSEYATLRAPDRGRGR
jgi:hypothetical protein